MILGMLAADNRRWLRQSNPAIWDWNGWGYGSTGKMSSSGERISPKTAKAFSAVYACIDIISTDTSVYPVDIIENVGPEKTVKANDQFPDIHRMLNGSANNAVLAMNLRKFVMAQMLGYGNGIGEIQRDGFANPIMLHGLESDRIRPAYDETTGELAWDYTGHDNITRRISGMDVIHFMGPSDNGVTGTSVLRYAADAVGSGLAQQRYTGSFYRNGASPAGTIKYGQKISKEAAEEIVRDWDAIHAGGAGAMNKTAFLPHGMEWTATAISPKDAELIDSKKFSVEEVCRFYRVHPDKVQSHGQAKGWATTEAYNRNHLIETLMPWLERAEAEYNRKLLPPGGKYYTQHNYDRLLEPDAVQRAERYTKLISVGGIKPNEVREREGLNPGGPEGDKLYIMSNLVPIEEVGKPADPQPQPPAIQPQPDDDDGEPTPDDGDGSEEARYDALVSRMVEKSARRLLRIEGDRMRSLCAKNKTGDDMLSFARKHAVLMAREFADVLDVAETAFAAWCLGTAVSAAVEYDSKRSSAQDMATKRESALPAQWAKQLVALASAIGDGK